MSESGVKVVEGCEGFEALAALIINNLSGRKVCEVPTGRDLSGGSLTLQLLLCTVGFKIVKEEVIISENAFVCFVIANLEGN